MASMMAKACTGPSNHMRVKTSHQKKSRNKRKLRRDPSSPYPDNTVPSPSNEPTTFKFSAEKFDSHDFVNGCDICGACQAISDALELNHGISCDAEADMSELEDIDISEELYGTEWSGIAEFQLEELVLSSLDVIFRSATRKIVAEGYGEELASKAILRTGIWYGREDIVTNIVENTLVLLRTGHEIDTSKGHYFEDLQEMERFVLAELICLLRDVRPFLSNGDTMWCLLMSDMNVSHACVMDAYPSRTFLDGPSQDSSPSVSAKNPSKNGLEDSDTNASVAQCKPENVDSPEATFDTNQSLVCASKLAADSTGECGKNPNQAADSTWDYGKKRSVEGTKGFNVPPSNTNHTLASTIRVLSRPTIDADGTDDDSSVSKSNRPSMLPRMMIEHFALPFADTELSLSIHVKNTEDPVPMVNDECQEQPYLPTTREQMITNLSSRIKELQNLLQEWSEWTNQKVMQVARRLSKDREELQALKKEKEDGDRLRKQRQKFEEGALRKLSEMENALGKISGQIERGNVSVRGLGALNVSLRCEMEAAKLKAMESSANCKEMLKREKETLMHIGSLEKMKSALQNDLSLEKSKVDQLNQKLRKAKDCKDHIEARLNQEEAAKNELLSQLTSFRQHRERIEASAQSKEDKIKSKAESNLRQHKEDITKLEKEISQLRLKTSSSKIAALKRQANKPDGFKDTSARKDFPGPHVSRITTPHHHHHQVQGFNGGERVKRERECVMCLTEEISVVFLPCAHQVVCVGCNEVHQKRGMKDCPSCRTAIERRVCVRFAAARSLV